MLRRLAAVLAKRRARRPPTPGQVAATEALQRAEADREVSRRRRSEVAVAAERLRQLRSDNNFAERIRLTLEGGR